jgi:hypothetical protein
VMAPKSRPAVHKAPLPVGKRGGRPKPPSSARQHTRGGGSGGGGGEGVTNPRPHEPAGFGAPQQQHRPTTAPRSGPRARTLSGIALGGAGALGGTPTQFSQSLAQRLQALGVHRHGLREPHKRTTATRCNRTTSHRRNEKGSMGKIRWEGKGRHVGGRGGRGSGRHEEGGSWGRGC